MPKFDENINCHFFPEDECIFPIPKEILEEALAHWDKEEDGNTLSQIPAIDDSMCTNCLLSQILYNISSKQEN
jgi:hypothetical protein